jgi:ribosomal protein S18 acetylase RimI-like enzyme
VTLRPLTPDDIPAWAALSARIEEHDDLGAHDSAEDLAEELADPEAEVGADFIGAVDGGRLVGFACVLPRGESDGAYTVILRGAVLPSRRGEGIGSTLVRAMVERGTVVGRSRRADLPTRLLVHGRADDADQEGLLRAAGFEPRRWTLVMTARLDRLRAGPPLPEGYRILRYDDSMAESLREAHNTAFHGHHPGFTPWTPAQWRQHVTGSRSFRPGLTRVVVPDDAGRPADPAAIAAYVVTLEFAAHREATGRRLAHVSRVGTAPGHRGRGLATAVLGHCLGAYRDAGYDEASLHVDSQNPTGALRVYERAGFDVRTRMAGYSLTVQP